MGSANSTLQPDQEETNFTRRRFSDKQVPKLTFTKTKSIMHHEAQNPRPALYKYSCTSLCIPAKDDAELNPMEPNELRQEGDHSPYLLSPAGAGPRNLMSLQGSRQPSMTSSGSYNSKSSLHSISSLNGIREFDDPKLFIYSTNLNRDIKLVQVQQPDQDESLSIERYDMFSSEDESEKKESTNFQMTKMTLRLQSQKLFDILTVKNKIEVKDLVKLEILGEGKYGKVYRAFHKETRKFYALKEVEIEDSSHISSAWNEIHILIKIQELNNPDILEVFGIDCDSIQQFSLERQHYSLIMELGSGTLLEYAEFRISNNIPWEEYELIIVLWLLLNQYTHFVDAGIFHRDIKPANIVLGKNSDQLKMIDLGVGYMGPATVQFLDLMGTPFYLAPELYQAYLDNDNHCDYNPALSDLFSIAMTVIKIINPNLNRKTYLNELPNIKQQYPTFWSYIEDLMSEDPNIRYKKSQALKKIFVGKPDFKFKEIARFQDFLYEQFLDNIDQGISCTHAEVLRNLFLFKEAEDVLRRKIEDENHVKDSKILCDLKYSLGLCYADSGQFDKAKKEYEGALIQQVALRGEVHISVAKTLEGIGAVLKAQGKYDEALEGFKKARIIKERLYGSDHILCANSYNNIGLVLYAQGKIQDALNNYQKALNLKSKLLQEDHPSVALTLDNIGLAYKNQGRYDMAMSNYRRSLRIKRKHFGENHPSVAQTYNNIGGLFIAQGKYQDAIDYFESSIEIKKSCLGESTLDVALTYDNLCIVYQNLAEYTKALELFDKSLDIKKKFLSPKHPDIALAYNNLGSIYYSQGKYNEALATYQQALEINQKCLDPYHRAIGVSYLNIGSAHQALRKYNIALSSYKEALNILLKVHGEYHPDIALIYNNLGAIHEKQENHKEALEKYNKSLVIKTKLFGEKHPSLSSTYNNLGLVYEKQGKFADALVMYKKAVKLKLSTLGENHPSIGTTYNNMGLVYYKLGKHLNALEMYNLSLDVKKKNYGEEHPSVADTYINIGNLHKAQLKKGNAMDFYNKAMKIYTTSYEPNHPNIARLKKNMENLNR